MLVVRKKYADVHMKIITDTGSPFYASSVAGALPRPTHKNRVQYAGCQACC